MAEMRDTGLIAITSDLTFSASLAVILGMGLWGMWCYAEELRIIGIVLINFFKLRAGLVLHS